MQVKEIMTKEVKFIEPNLTLREAAKILKDRDIGALPIGENDRIIGFITDRDIAVRALANGHDPQKITVREIMTPKCLYCFEEESVEEAAKNMAKNQIRRLPVLNKDKKLVGIISIGDIVIKGSKPAAAEALFFISQKAR